MKFNIERRTNSDRQRFFNGTFKENFNALVTATTGPDVVTLSIEKDGGGDLTMQFSDGLTFFDTTPATTIELTAGLDNSTTENFIFIPKSTKVLTKSTSSFPSEEHIHVGYFVVPSATFVESRGVYVNQNWNDDLSDSVGQGDLSHIGEKLRRLPASYFSGVDPNGTDGYLTPTNLDTRFKSTSGLILQKHEHTFEAIDTSSSDIVLVKNWPGDSFHDISNLFDITTDSTGTTIGNNKFFNLIAWGVGNKTGEFSPVIINLPAGFYNTSSGALSDASSFDDFTMPREYNRESSTGFLIARITIQMKTSGTWVVVATTDLRGQIPTTATGGVSSILSDFIDNTFEISNVTDNTKMLMFDVSGVTTGTTITLQIPDLDGEIALMGVSQTTDFTTTGTIKANLFDSNDLTIGDDGSDYIFDDTAATGTKRFIFKLNGDNSNASAWALWNPGDNFNTGMLFADGETIRFNAGIHSAVEINDTNDDSVLAFRVLHDDTLSSVGRSSCFYIDGHNELTVSGYALIADKSLTVNEGHNVGPAGDIILKGTDGAPPSGQSIEFQVAETIPTSRFLGSGADGLYIHSTRLSTFGFGGADFQFLTGDRFKTLQDISLINNKNLLLGTDDDMQVFFTGSQAWVNTDVGSLRFGAQAGNFIIMNSDSDDVNFLVKTPLETFAFFVDAGAETAAFGIPLTMNADIIMANTQNFIFNTSTGTQIGTAANQKLSLYGVNPIAQQTGVAVTVEAIHEALVNLGAITA